MMPSQRCLFASTCLEYRYIYVYGGISGSEDFIKPQLQANLIERYDSIANTWTPFTVEGAPKLSAFGWCSGIQPHELFILGGTEGGNFQDSLWKLDFKEQKAYNICQFVSEIGMSKVAVYEDDKGEQTVFNFGGTNSGGLCYKREIRSAKD